MRTWRSLLTIATASAATFATPGVAAADPPTIEVPAEPGPTESAAPSDLPTDLPIDIRPNWAFAENVPEYGPVTNASVTITGAADWHTAGIDGTGVRIGVIDFFDVPLFWNVAEHGPVPVAGATARCLDNGADCTGEFFDGVNRGSEDHGVAVVEIIKDMAPGAQIYLARALTADDYRSIVDWFAAEGVTVINRSLGSRYDGPGDGRGGIDSIAGYAISRGIAWVNSGGNGGIGRYYRHAVRLAGTRVAFGPSGAEVFLKFNGCISLGGVRWANDWDLPPSQRTDYDVFVWDSPLGNPAAGAVIASSMDNQRAGAPPIENIAASLCPSGSLSERSLYLEVRWNGGDTTNDVLEILEYGAGMASFTQIAGSASTGVVDSREEGVLAVGAIDPANSGGIAAYSSRGPTNDGRIAPDISAPANFVSTVRRGGFAGTSAAAAVVSGGAALLLDGGLAADPRSLGNLIRHLALDRGDPGPDNAYGYGEFRLPGPPTDIDTTPSTFVATAAPQRLLDTRPESAVGPAALIGRVPAGGIRDLPVLGQAGVPPSGVTAVAVNVTAVDIEAPTYVQALPTLRAAAGGYSNINTDAAGQTRANLAIVPIGAGGSISLYTISGGHLVVDLLGYFIATPQPGASGRFVEIAPQRLLDSRTDGGALANLAWRGVPWPAGIDSASVQALVVTVTGTEASEPGWIQAYPADRPDVVGRTSTVNLVPGVSVANTAIVPVGSAGIAVAGWFGTGSGHVVVDVVGYVTSAAAPTDSAGRFVPVRPGRAFDSRTSTGDLTVAQPVTIDASQGGTPIPADATAVVWNMAAVDAAQPGFGRVWSAETAQPATSAFNWSLAGETRAAAVIAAVDAGRVQVVMDNGTGQPTSIAGGLIADVFGYFT